MEKQKHILSMLLLIATCLFSNNAFAEAVEIDGIYYNLVTKAKQAEVTSNPSRYRGAVNIPETVSYNNVTYSVTSIGDDAFSGCSDLTSVTIPNSVTSIGGDAFDSCTGLKKVIVTDIAAWCGISFGYSSNSNPLSYAKHLYSDETTEITDLVIPNSVTSIGDWAFNECSGLTSINIPDSVTKIGKFAFDSCKRLADVYCYAEKVPSTESDAFEDSCIEYASLHVPAASIEQYKTTKPWSDFGTIVAIDDTETQTP